MSKNIDRDLVLEIIDSEIDFKNYLKNQIKLGGLLVYSEDIDGIKWFKNSFCNSEFVLNYSNYFINFDKKNRKKLIKKVFYDNPNFKKQNKKYKNKIIAFEILLGEMGYYHRIKAYDKDFDYSVNFIIDELFNYMLNDYFKK